MYTYINICKPLLLYWYNYTALEIMWVAKIMTCLGYKKLTKKCDQYEIHVINFDSIYN